MTDLADAGQIGQDHLNQFNQLTAEEQTAYVQVLEEQQRIQAGVDEEDDEQDGDHDEEEKDEDELDYDGIEGMEQQIEVEEEEDDGQAPLIGE